MEEQIGPNKKNPVQPGKPGKFFRLVSFPIQYSSVQTLSYVTMTSGSNVLLYVIKTTKALTTIWKNKTSLKFNFFQFSQSCGSFEHFNRRIHLLGHVKGDM